MGILYLFKSKFKRQLSRIKDNLKSITVINLNNKKINDKRFKKLLKLIKYSNKLKELHLRNNRITNANAEELIVCLEKGDFPYLEVIDLENNYIDQKHILNIEYILTFRLLRSYITKLNENSPNVIHLNLSSKMMTDDLLKELFSNIENYTYLKSIDLSNNNNLTNDSLHFILEKIKSESFSLEYLNLDDNEDLNPELILEIYSIISYNNIFKYLSPLENNSDDLIELNLARTNITDASLFQLISSLQNNKKLKNLNLSNNYITDSGGELLLKFLIENNYEIPLEFLDLSLNNIRDEVLHEIYSIIGDNLIQQYIERLIENDPNLIELNFSYKKLTDENIIKLSQALVQNKTVKKLYLSNTLLTDRGGEFLLEALQSNDCINWIRITNTNLSESLQKEIEDLIDKKG